MRKFWEGLVPMNDTEGGRAVTLFNCIHSLMSHQLQGLILRSLDHFLHTINLYNVNYTQTKGKQFMF